MEGREKSSKAKGSRTPIKVCTTFQNAPSTNSSLLSWLLLNLNTLGQRKRAICPYLKMWNYPGEQYTPFYVTSYLSIVKNVGYAPTSNPCKKYLQLEAKYTKNAFPFFFMVNWFEPIFLTGVFTQNDVINYSVCQPGLGSKTTKSKLTS